MIKFEGIDFKNEVERLNPETEFLFHWIEPSAEAPAHAVLGTTYYNKADNCCYMYTNDGWAQLTSPGV